MKIRSLKANNQSIYTTKLLQQCKTWGEPAANMEELNEISQKHSEIAEKVVRTEVSYYRDTHKTEISYQLHLFKVNRITHEERLINFCVLLGQNGQKVQEMNLPSNEETITIWREKDNPIEIQHTEIEVNQIYVTLWIEKNKHTWYIGHCIGNNNDGTYKIEHLHRVNKSSNLKWKNPTFPDISDVNPENILFIKLKEAGTFLKIGTLPSP